MGGSAGGKSMTTNVGSLVVDLARRLDSKRKQIRYVFLEAKSRDRKNHVGEGSCCFIATVEKFGCQKVSHQ